MVGNQTSSTLQQRVISFTEAYSDGTRYFPEDWNDKVWTIDEMIENGGEIPLATKNADDTLLSGLLLERAIEEGVLKMEEVY